MIICLLILKHTFFTIFLLDHLKNFFFLMFYHFRVCKHSHPTVCSPKHTLTRAAKMPSSTFYYDGATAAVPRNKQLVRSHHRSQSVLGVHDQPRCRVAPLSLGDDVTDSHAVPQAVIYELIWTCLLVLQVWLSLGTC